MQEIARLNWTEALHCSAQTACLLTLYLQHLQPYKEQNVAETFNFSQLVKLVNYATLASAASVTNDTALFSNNFLYSLLSGQC